METKEKSTHRGTGAFMNWRRPIIQTPSPPATTDVGPGQSSVALLSLVSVADKWFYFTCGCRSKILPVGEPDREGLHWAAAGCRTLGLQRGFANRQSLGNRVWQVKQPCSHSRDTRALNTRSWDLWCMWTFLSFQKYGRALSIHVLLSEPNIWRRLTWARVNVKGSHKPEHSHNVTVQEVNVPPHPPASCRRLLPPLWGCTVNLWKSTNKNGACAYHCNALSW